MGWSLYQSPTADPLKQEVPQDSLVPRLRGFGLGAPAVSKLADYRNLARYLERIVIPL